MKTSEIVKQNYELKKQLNVENEQFYNKFLVYVRANGLKDERAVEETLLEILQHLLEAQQAGRPAETVFGKNPKALADEVIESLPKESPKVTVLFAIEMLMLLIGVYIAVKGIPQVFTKDPTIVFVWNAFITFVVLVLGFGLIVWAGMRALKRDAYEEGKKKFSGNAFFILVFSAVTVCVGLIAVFVKPFGPYVTMPFYSLLGIGIALIAGSLLISKYRN